MLESILGKPRVRLILLYLELGDYVEDVNQLHSDFYNLFGTSSLLIEKAIVNKLFKRLGIPYPTEGEFNFAKHVSFARELFINGQDKPRESEFKEKLAIE